MLVEQLEVKIVTVTSLSELHHELKVPEGVTDISRVFVMVVVIEVDVEVLAASTMFNEVASTNEVLSPGRAVLTSVATMMREDDSSGWYASKFGLFITLGKP